MAIKINSGNSVNYTPSGADVVAGDVVVLGEIHGVALAAIADGDLGALAIEGIFEVAVLGTDVVAVGDLLYWDATNDRATLTASTHKVFGYATTASADGVVLVQAKLSAQEA